MWFHGQRESGCNDDRQATILDPEILQRACARALAGDVHSLQTDAQKADNNVEQREDILIAMIAKQSERLAALEAKPHIEYLGMVPREEVQRR